MIKGSTLISSLEFRYDFYLELIIEVNAHELERLVNEHQSLVKLDLSFWSLDTSNDS